MEMAPELSVKLAMPSSLARIEWWRKLGINPPNDWLTWQWKKLKPHTPYQIIYRLPTLDSHGALCFTETHTLVQIGTQNVLSSTLHISQDKNPSNTSYQSELEKYKTLTDRLTKAARIGTWEADLEKNVLTWSSMTKAIHEVPDTYEPIMEEAIGFYKAGASRDRLQQKLHACQNQLLPYDDEFEIITDKQNNIWVRAIGLPIVKNGKCVKMHGLFQDVDAKYRAAKRIAFNEELHRKTFDHSLIGMAMLGLDGNILKVNKALSHILGYSAKELHKVHFAEITHAKDVAEDLKAFQKIRDNAIEHYAIKKRYYHKSGRTIWAEQKVVLIKNDLGEPLHLLSQIEDITQREEGKAQLERSARKLQNIFDSTFQFIWLLSVNGKVLETNKTALDFAQLKPSDVTHKAFWNVFWWQNREENSTFLQHAIEAALNGHLVKKQMVVWNHQKEEITIDFSIKPALDANGDAEYLVAEGRPIEEMVQTQNEVKRLLDISTSQNSRLLNFAHIVSHNLKSHAGNIAMLVKILAENHMELAESPQFNYLAKASDGLGETIANLQEVAASRTQNTDSFEHMNLKPIVLQSLDAVKANLITTRASCRVSISDTIKIKGIPSYVESIVLNLITNALKYRSPKILPNIEIHAYEHEEYVAMSVKDNGLGIDLKKHRDALFGMYQTFHKHPEATGIGLFITRNQLDTMGGQIEVESEPGKGSTFTVYFQKTNPE